MDVISFPLIGKICSDAVNRGCGKYAKIRERTPNFSKRISQFACLRWGDTISHTPTYEIRSRMADAKSPGSSKVDRSGQEPRIFGWLDHGTAGTFRCMDVVSPAAGML